MEINQDEIQISLNVYKYPRKFYTNVRIENGTKFTPVGRPVFFFPIFLFLYAGKSLLCCL